LCASLSGNNNCNTDFSCVVYIFEGRNEEKLIFIKKF